MTSAISKITAFLGVIALVLGALFHLTGLSLVTAEASHSSNEFFQKAVAPVWMFTSVHWIAFAAIAIATIILPSRHSRIALLTIAAAVSADAILTINALGPFVGGYILAAAGTLFFIAAIFYGNNR